MARTRAIWLTEAEWKAISAALVTIMRWEKNRVYGGDILRQMASAQTKIERRG